MINIYTKPEAGWIPIWVRNLPHSDFDCRKRVSRAVNWQRLSEKLTLAWLPESSVDEPETKEPDNR